MQNLLLTFHIVHTLSFSMASVGIDTGGSQFYVSLSPAPHMNGRCVAFGRLDAQSEPVLANIEKVWTPTLLF